MKNYKLPEVLRDLLKENEMSYRELSYQINANENSIGKWVRDEALPSLWMVIDMADFFGVSIDYLVSGEK